MKRLNRGSRFGRGLALWSILLSPCAVSAHEVVHRVAHDRAVAVQALHADGQPLSEALFEVFSPARPDAPHASGRADPAGWIAFVPDTAGTWRVNLADATGHGLGLEVAVERIGSDAAPVALEAAHGHAHRWASHASFVLRPLAGVAAIGLVFAALYRLRKRKGPAA